MTNRCKGWKLYWEKSTILWLTDKIEMWMVDQIKFQSWVYEVGDSAMIILRWSSSLENTQHSTQWWKAMIYAVCLYGSEKKLYVSACMCEYMHMCVCSCMPTDRKSKWGKMLTIDESDRFIYLSTSLKLSPNIKTERKRIARCHKTLWVFPESSSMDFQLFSVS